MPRQFPPAVHYDRPSSASWRAACHAWILRQCNNNRKKYVFIIANNAIEHAYLTYLPLALPLKSQRKILFRLRGHSTISWLSCQLRRRIGSISPRPPNSRQPRQQGSETSATITLNLQARCFRSYPLFSLTTLSRNESFPPTPTKRTV